MTLDYFDYSQPQLLNIKYIQFIYKVYVGRKKRELIVNQFIV